MPSNVKRTRTIATVAAAAVLLTASPALARKGEERGRPQRFEGPVAAVDADSVTIGTTEIPLATSTRYSSPKRLVRSAADLRVGDWVRVEQRGAAATRVQLRLVALEGTASDAGADGLTVEVEDANRPGDAWLGDATSADVAYTDATRFDDDVEPLVGDEVEVLARVSADDPAALEAVDVTPEGHLVVDAVGGRRTFAVEVELED